jgi:ribosomal protein S18 acetylase RimI-like enzyme
MMKMFEHRPVQLNDLPAICSFPQNAEELFFMFPAGKYPLTPDQLEEAINKRWVPTVVLQSGVVVGYANVFGLEEGVQCQLGNFIVAPDFRGSGAAEFLIEAIAMRCKNELKVSVLRLGCHNTNTRALCFYYKLGFEPYGLHPMKNHLGDPIVTVCMEMRLE